MAVGSGCLLSCVHYFESAVRAHAEVRSRPLALCWLLPDGDSHLDAPVPCVQLCSCHGRSPTQPTGPSQCATVCHLPAEPAEATALPCVYLNAQPISSQQATAMLAEATSPVCCAADGARQAGRAAGVLPPRQEPLQPYALHLPTVCSCE